MRFFLETGSRLSDARNKVLLGLAEGSITPAPTRRQVSETAARAFLAEGGMSEDRIDRAIQRSRDYDTQRSRIIAREATPSASNRPGQP